MLEREFLGALKQFHRLTVQCFAVEDFCRMDLALDVCLNRCVGMVGIKTSQNALVQAVLCNAEAVHKGLLRKLLHQRGFIVLGLSVDGVKEPLVVVLVADHMARREDLEVALLGLGHGLDQAVQAIGCFVRHGGRVLVDGKCITNVIISIQLTALEPLFMEPIISVEGRFETQLSSKRVNSRSTIPKERSYRNEKDREVNNPTT